MHFYKHWWIQIIFLASIFTLLITCFVLTHNWFTPWWVSIIIFFFSTVLLIGVMAYWLYIYGDLEEGGNNDEEKQHLILHPFSVSSIQTTEVNSISNVQSY